ncbi:MAG: alpha/beta hydrolase [Tissierellia bacterium]|nr:alpha/beta hydrolase [Tissierellia bacterium]
MCDFELKYIQLPTGENLSFRQKGKGKKNLILIHGNYCSSIVWTPIMDALGEDYKLFAPDLRGFGHSSYHNRGRDLKVYAEDIIAFIEALHLEEVYLLGWSAGGGVAMEVAAALGKRVQALVLISSISTRGYRSDYSIPLAMTKLVRFMFPVPMYFLDNLNLFQKISDITNDRNELGLYLDTLLFNRSTPDREYREACIDALLLQRNNLDYWEAMTNFNITDTGDNIAYGTGRIYDITAPVIVMQGIYDRIVPFKDAQQIVADFGEEATLVSFKSSGHCIFLDQPKKFEENIRWVLEKDFSMEHLDVS